MNLPESLLVAVQFLTRVPVRVASPDAAVTVRSLYWYPVVGLLIGAALYSIASWPVSAFGVLAALVLVIWVLVTGALHLDGLADSADAWLGGSGDRERTLAIMQDSRVGAAGAVAVVLVLLGKFAAVETLLETDRAEILLAVCALARAAVPLLFATTDYVRPGGLGEALAQGAHPALAGKVVAASVLGVLLLLHWDGMVCVLAMGVLFLACRHLMRRRIGGATGDTTGALIEVLEGGALLAVVLFG